MPRIRRYTPHQEQVLWPMQASGAYNWGRDYMGTRRHIIACGRGKVDNKQCNLDQIRQFEVYTATFQAVFTTVTTGFIN